VKLLRKLLILSHRYLGIALCLLIAMWFASRNRLPLRLGHSQRLPKGDLDLSHVFEQTPMLLLRVERIMVEYCAARNSHQTHNNCEKLLVQTCVPLFSRLFGSFPLQVPDFDLI